MSRKVTAQTPTDQDILGYNNVPVEVAAKYIGWSSCNVCYALQQERAPYGTAARTSETSWTYNISPGLLIAYKRGTLEAWKLGGLMKVLNTEINEIIDMRLGEIVGIFADSAARKRAS